ncbi:MAG: hypothetical protein DRJ03_17905 [Chloroflexi bacterium]|nr:MAG: hypothetical protein DRI81_11635 [Chloroflexota bacterium]RLC83204.1 MAG: hypothetical protein DRJ03_17905 [Chloroflexota bacterium]
MKGAADSSQDKVEFSGYSINLEAARRERNVHPVVYVEIKALAPPRSRLIHPRLTRQPSLQPAIA